MTITMTKLRVFFFGTLGLLILAGCIRPGDGDRQSAAYFFDGKVVKLDGCAFMGERTDQDEVEFRLIRAQSEPECRLMAAEKIEVER